MADRPRGRRPERLQRPGSRERGPTQRGAAPLRGERRLWAPGQHSPDSGPRGAPHRPSNVAQDSRQKRCRSRSGGPRENRAWEEKGRGRPAPGPAAAKPRSESSRARSPRRAGRAHSPQRPKNRRTRSRSPAGSISSAHRQKSLEPGSPPCKRPRHPPAPAQEPGDAPLSGLLTHLGALEESLRELQAPGGAFLPLAESAPSEALQPSASQRAWLAWHLAHAGANLHWALSGLDKLLAEQLWRAGAQPVPQGAPWSWDAQGLWRPPPS